MSSFPNSPRVLKGGIVLIDADSAAVQRIITLQYNPDTLSRTLQPQTVRESGDRSEAMRLTGPPVETIKLDAEIDATDQLEFPDKNEQNKNAVKFGIHPQLAALETVIYPGSAKLIANNALAATGMLEILPMISSLTLFVWSKSRVVPVRITDFSVTEEAFDTALNPIRAKVSLGESKGGSLFMAYHQLKEQLGAKSQGGVLSTLGLGGIP
jgi:hypothetical protein